MDKLELELELFHTDRINRDLFACVDKFLNTNKMSTEQANLVKYKLRGVDHLNQAIKAVRALGGEFALLGKVSIDGWSTPRLIKEKEGYLYLQVGRCKDCSICTSRIDSIRVKMCPTSFFVENMEQPEDVWVAIKNKEDAHGLEEVSDILHKEIGVRLVF